MISNAMLSRPESRGFLINGFPRELRQAKEFERIVSDPGLCECVVRCETTPPSPPGMESRRGGPQEGRRWRGGKDVLDGQGTAGRLLEASRTWVDSW